MSRRPHVVLPRPRLTRSAALGLALAGLIAGGCGGAGSPTARLRITIRPSTALIDSSPAIRISGLRSGESVRVTAMTPRLQNVWRARATFVAGRGGTVDLARARPRGHVYDGTAALGLLGVQTPGQAISLHRGPLVTTFRVRAGTRMASATLRQRLRAPDVTARVQTVARDGFDGRLYLPPGHARRPGVVVWGGSEGGLSTGEEWGEVLASHGIAALGIAYFDAPSLPCALSDIPLEYFARAIRWMARRPGVDPRRVWLLSASRGTEAEALVAAHFPGLVHGFVAAAPSSIAYGSFPGRCQPRGDAAWTLHGRPLPHAVVDIAAGETRSGSYDSRRAFLATLHTARTRRARIPIAGFRGPVLLLAGADDQLWPSPVYATQLMRELRHDPAPHVRRVYPGAGHYVLDPPSLPSPARTPHGVTVGGSEAADDAAHRVDWPLTWRFIQRH